MITNSREFWRAQGKMKFLSRFLLEVKRDYLKTLFLQVKIVSKHRKEQKLRNNIAVLYLSKMKTGLNSNLVCTQSLLKTCSCHGGATRGELIDQ